MLMIGIWFGVKDYYQYKEVEKEKKNVHA